MAWTYSGNPTTSDKDAVRFLIGDTDTTDQQLQDEEILYLLTIYPDVYDAAVAAARSLASKYSRQADTRIGDYSISASQRAAAYLALAKEIQQQQVALLIHKAKPYAGGISIADKEQDETNTDRVRPAFTRHDMTFPGTSDDFDREE